MLCQLLIGTRNKGKISEIASGLSGHTLELLTLQSFPAMPEPEEMGPTFMDNAALKSRYYAVKTGILTLADDSGLEVDALGGAPGLLSARYAASDGERIARLMRELEEADAPLRNARFVCAMALTDPTHDETTIFLGECKGKIASTPRGSRGFGYDPIFIPEGYVQTFGELSPEFKQRVSHRAQALEKTAAFLRQRLVGA